MSVKKKYQVYIILILACFAAAYIGATLAQTAVSSNERIAEFYATETAVMVSPHGLRKQMMRGNDEFILVDLRSPEEYAEEHILGAINIPAYKDRDTSDYGAKERIVNSFKELYPTDKDIIIYCYSIPCMTGRKVGHMLAEEEVYVKELGVGWNEWRYFWTLWNHPHEWNVTNVSDYVISGTEPGNYDALKEKHLILNGCTLSDEFGC